MAFRELPELEVLSLPAQGAARTPILFIHGAYVGAWVWQEHFMPFFAERGWPVWALSLSGHGGSDGHATLDAFSLDDYVADVARVAAQLPAPPVLIGHSMGGMVVQKYLEQHTAAAAVLLASVPPDGLFSATLGLMMQKPRLLMELNTIMGGGTPHLETLREALFHQPVSPQRLQAVFERCQPESMRVLWDMTLFNLPRLASMNRPPMLILGAAEDRLVPPAEVERTARIYDLPVQILPAMGHGMMLEASWQQPAQRMADWLLAEGL
jgi:pimeloyl-ACP methyl ester carboxylesterase